MARMNPSTMSPNRCLPSPRSIQRERVGVRGNRCIRERIGGTSIVGFAVLVDFHHCPQSGQVNLLKWWDVYRADGTT